MTKRSNDSGLEWVRQDIAARGVKVAYEALVDVAGDKKAPSPARATAGVAIMRAAGLQNPKPPPQDVEPVDMSFEEMSRGLGVMRARLAQLDKEAELARLDREAAERELADEEDLGSDEEERDLFA